MNANNAAGRADDDEGHEERYVVVNTFQLDPDWYAVRPGVEYARPYGRAARLARAWSEVLRKLTGSSVVTVHPVQGSDGRSVLHAYVDEAEAAELMEQFTQWEKDGCRERR
jgi:hypothetical protein